ncbi:hypothetical protein V8D89_015048 [Ganoderma adspersum]
MAATLWGDNWPVFCPNCREALRVRNADENESKWAWSRLPTIFRVKLDLKESWPFRRSRREMGVFVHLRRCHVHTDAQGQGPCSLAHVRYRR